jgi:signal transduction histidine kinase
LSAHLNNLQLLVKDDGLGFDMQGVKKGNGLKNLNERSNAAGGSLTYQTEMGKGTSIQLEVPIT